MSPVTGENPEKIFDRLDTDRFAAIQATGAIMKDIVDAKAIADGEIDIVGQRDQANPSPVKQVLTIHSGEAG